ncbi:hypothetical protein PTSG_07955 [Salpingoeca rosetta]|uniref:Uncharacterized protein n=1 Tax=Salpingoeca rosetta (strain ATCC 50818 / BSB-021) TaxID=946362 RepID=F2UGT7_SALR5|nr:uncharacterized protein PTSG_07955 [Salpingoeca rosetta]EGD75837.1 hypothetical protein PTSG_07955 [Salpingoeca rosetta]|eukprot:XP_004991758.1 hypothetical protein PTSG_07955 [Salpingoeca rosetta]
MMHRLLARAMRARAAPLRQGARNASHGGADAHKYSESVTPIEPSPMYSYAATGMGAVMWFWILWRAKHDLPHLLGFEHPWDHLHEHGDEEHH